MLLMGAALIAMVPFEAQAVAQEQDVAEAQDGTEAQNGTEVVPTADVDETLEEEAVVEAPIGEHEFFGDIVMGWRAFIDRPPSGFGFGPDGVPLTAKQTQSRAKFEQFGEVPEGVFLEHLHLGAATADGSLVADFRASHVGYNNQNYVAQLYQPGRHYLLFEWDQIPHLSSTSAKTLYNTRERDNLTIADPVREPPDGLQGTWGTPAADDIVNSNVRRLELSTRRDTGRVSYAFTPSPAWDFRAEYSHERKKGRQAFSTALNQFQSSIEIPGPIDYTTQNFGASAQYVGTYGDNRRFNINLAYSGSIFENAFDSVIFDNPFRFDPPTGNNNTANRGHHSLAPDNFASRYTLTTGVDLPFDSRYMGTVSFNQMRQDEDFLAQTVNPILAPSPLPATSANAKIDTLLINNVLTTRLTSALTSTLRYRYYDNNNRTPMLLFNDYVRSDGALVTTDRQSLPVAYTRQNASAELNWRAQPWLRMGAQYGWERYDRDRRDVDVTDEHSGKISADVTPVDWMRLRASYLHAQRRFDNYDHLNFVAVETYPPVGAGVQQNPLLRKFDLTDRDRHMVDASVELMTPIEGLLVTPMFGWRDDEFSDGSTSGGELGLKEETAWKAGVEVAYAPTSAITLFAGYVREEFERGMVNRQSGFGAPALCIGDASACNWGSTIEDVVDTFYATMNLGLIPDRLDFKLGYTFSQSVGKTDTFALGAGGVTSNPQFPNVKNTFHRLDAVLTHKMDPDLVRRLGWVGDVTASLGYSFERNRMTNWQIDDIVPYMRETDGGAGRSLFLASINPNYTAHFLGGTIGFHW
jgi:MtrB/PioB family decaheme-associated outer membrane protein